jgi:hypothetical protein
MFKVNLPPCLRCLKVCPGCKDLPPERRRALAEAAILILKESFPVLFSGQEELEKD